MPEEFLTEAQVFNTPRGEKRIVVTKEKHLQWCGFSYPGTVEESKGTIAIPRERKCVQRELYSGEDVRWKDKYPVCAMRVIEPHHLGGDKLCFVNRVGGQWVPEHLDFTKRKMMVIIRFPWQDYMIYSEDNFMQMFKEVV